MGVPFQPYAANARADATPPLDLTYLNTTAHQLKSFFRVSRRQRVVNVAALVGFVQAKIYNK
eukprot:40527-Eustigmatos_ZCMA.PRE.1